MDLIKDNGNWSDLNILIEQRTIKHYSFDFWNTIAYSNPQFKKERAIYICEYRTFVFKISSNNLPWIS